MDFALPLAVREALERLRQAGFSAYVVGGCVRDWVLGIPPHDYDICTSARPKDMQRVFQGERTVETGLRHGTLTVLLGDMPLEITTFRQDGEYQDGRHPVSVCFTARVEEDLARRDFTINAMAYAPGEGLVDPFGGREDCRRGVIRCVGEAQARFSEDALRILRALRFSARLAFPIEAQTAQAVRALAKNLEKISRERVASELTGLLMGQDAASVLRDYAGVLFSVLPSLAPMAACPRADGDPACSVWEHTLRAVDFAPREATLRWAALLHDCEQPACRREEQAGDAFPEHAEKSAEAARSILRELKMPARFTQTVAELALWHEARFDLAEVQEMLLRIGSERLDQLLLLQRADGLAEAGQSAEAAEERYGRLEAESARLFKENACRTLAQLAVKGEDMVALGLRGPQIGAMLERLLLAVARREIPNHREALLRFARTHLG